MPDPPADRLRQLARQFGAAEWQADDFAAGAEVAATEPTPEPPEPPELEVARLFPRAVADSDAPPVEQIVEAILFAGGDPFDAPPEAELVAAGPNPVVRGLSRERLAEVVAQLNRRYRAQNRPYTILAEPGGYSMRLRPSFAPPRAPARPAKLSAAALEVLSLVAYNQPLSAARIDQVRGHPSGTALRQLVRLGLVAVAPGAHGDSAYRTTPRLLETLGLSGLDELPQVGPALFLPPLSQEGEGWGGGAPAK